MDQRLLDLERMVVDAWPAAETADIDGWLLRASGGPTHRGNSAATLGAIGPLSLADRIERTERWYRQRGQPAMFQIGPCASPPGLDAALAARGYEVAGAARFAAARASLVLERTAHATGGRAHVTSSPTRAWLDINASASRFATRIDSFLGFVARLGSRCRFVTVHAGPDARDAEPAPSGPGAATEEAIAAALGVTGPGQRFGVYAMLTAPAFRRRGAARLALHALAQRAEEEGLHELYLLFEPSNVAARALYAASGFVDVYDYHYRSKLQSDAP